MLSGFLAATVVNTTLDKPELDAARMLQFMKLVNLLIRGT
jgi:clorobiocin biosynthesis protein Clo-hal/halogenation protein CepH